MAMQLHLPTITKIILTPWLWASYISTCYHSEVWAQIMDLFWDNLCLRGGMTAQLAILPFGSEKSMAHGR
jgi:hypothetical protein